MGSRWKAILISTVLCAFLPTFMIGLVDKKSMNIQSPGESSTKKEAEKQWLNVLMGDGSIERKWIEDYLVGVLLCEMPVEFGVEAMKAQAVVARTYALRRNEKGGKHAEAAVCTDSGCCQGYKDPALYRQQGGSVESVEKVRNAVACTSDTVLVYDGDLIDATYFSCSGGLTEDAQAVWGEEIPYLRCTVSPGEEQAKHYVETVTMSKNEFLSKLDLASPEDGKRLIGEIAYTSGGGIDTIMVCGNIYSGTEFRRLLGLNSTAVILSVIGDHVTITTKGYGHRVGMSQYGAEAMAAQGHLYPDILLHYYRGVKLVEYNDN